MPKKYWTKELLIKEAKKYKKRNYFITGSRGAYDAARKLDILDEICSHMEKRFIWTEELLIKEAKKYKRRTVFKKNKDGAYKKAVKLNILDKICSHMEIVGNRMERYLYSFEFPDKSVYVGLTYDYKKRYIQHMTSNKIIIYKTEKLGHTFVMYNELYSYKNVGSEEKKLIDNYKKKGWKILNKIKGGGLGGYYIDRVDENTIIEEILKYETKREFKSKNKKFFNRVRNSNNINILNAYYSLCNKTKNPNKIECKKEALKYKRRVDFKRNALKHYTRSLALGIIDEVCIHMNTSFWDIKSAKEEFLKYKCLTNLIKKSHGAYTFAKNNNKIEEFSKHMTKPKRWSTTSVRKEALKYKKRIKFARESSGAYEYARKRGKLDEFCSHMH